MEQLSAGDETTDVRIVCVCLCVSPLLRKCFWFYSSIRLGIGDFTFKSQIYSNIVTQYLCICTVVHLRVCRLLIFKAACGWSLEVKGHHLDCEAHTSHFLALLSVHSSALYISHSQEESICARTVCGAGRECAPNGRGEPVCHCLQVRLPVVTQNHFTSKESTHLHKRKNIQLSIDMKKNFK